MQQRRKLHIQEEASLVPRFYSRPLHFPSGGSRLSCHISGASKFNIIRPPRRLATYFASDASASDTIAKLARFSAWRLPTAHGDYPNFWETAGSRSGMSQGWVPLYPQRVIDGADAGSIKVYPTMGTFRWEPIVSGAAVLLLYWSEIEISAGKVGAFPPRFSVPYNWSDHTNGFGVNLSGSKRRGGKFDNKNSTGHHFKFLSRNGSQVVKRSLYCDNFVYRSFILGRKRGKWGDAETVTHLRGAQHVALVLVEFTNRRWWFFASADGRSGECPGAVGLRSRVFQSGLRSGGDAVTHLERIQVVQAVRSNLEEEMC